MKASGTSIRIGFSTSVSRKDWRNKYPADNLPEKPFLETYMCSVRSLGCPDLLFSLACLASSTSPTRRATREIWVARRFFGGRSGSLSVDGGVSLQNLLNRAISRCRLSTGDGKWSRSQHDYRTQQPRHSSGAGNVSSIARSDMAAAGSRPNHTIAVSGSGSETLLKAKVSAFKHI